MFKFKLNVNVNHFNDTYIALLLPNNELARIQARKKNTIVFFENMKRLVKCRVKFKYYIYTIVEAIQIQNMKCFG